MMGLVMKKILSFIEKHEVLLVILCGVMLMRLPGLFEPSRYADEDIYLTIGRAMRRGLLLYRDIYDNKTPLIYVVAMIAGNVMWFRFILMIWNLVSVGLIWGVAKKLLSNKWGVTLATVLFAVFTTLPLLEGEIANGEVFMIMPVAGAIYLVLSKTGNLVEKKINYLWAGLLWSVAFLFKSPPLIELFGLFFFMTIYLAGSLRDLFRRFFDLRLWLLGIGFLVPVLVSVVYFFWRGIGGLYLRSALLQNFGYLSSWDGGKGDGLITRGLVMLAILALIWAFRKKLGNNFGLIAIWAITAIFGAFLSGRPYPHYLIEAVGPMALLISFVLFQTTIYTALFGVAIASLLAFGVVRYKFWYYQSLPYYQNFVSYVFGQKSKEQFYNFWGDNVTRNYEAAAFVDQITAPNDRLFVWGTEPALYVIGNRAPAVKYVVSYHILDFSAQGEIGESLAKERPKVIVVIKNEPGKFSELSGIIDANYALAGTFGELLVYLRLK